MLSNYNCPLCGSAIRCWILDSGKLSDYAFLCDSCRTTIEKSSASDGLSEWMAGKHHYEHYTGG